MECRLRNFPTKRVFGKDITNFDLRRPKASSITDKPLPIHAETRPRSLSSSGARGEGREATAAYEGEILAHMLSLGRREREELMGQVTVEMRAILVDWLVDVHFSFELREQTLFLALAYLNEYCAVAEVTRQDYQLVGVACLWIASKYEEIYPPRMSAFTQVTDSSYSPAELKAMEGRILLALAFALNRTTPLQILEAVADRWPKDGNGKFPRESAKTLCMAKYLLELSLFEGLGRSYCVRTLVLSALMLTDSVLKGKSDTKALDSERPDRETLMRCFKDMCLALEKASKSSVKLRAIKKKFSGDKYMGVARFRIEQK